MAEEVHQVLKTLDAMNSPNATLHWVSIASLNYGLLCVNDVKNLEVGDVVLFKEKMMIFVTFNHQRKQRNEGFSYNVPNVFYSLFECYIGELCKNTISSGKL